MNIRMKNFSLCILLCLCFIVGIVTAGQGSSGLKSPAGGATPQVIHMAAIPDARMIGNKSVLEIPVGYEMDKSQFDQLKSAASSDNGTSSIMTSKLSTTRKLDGGGGNGGGGTPPSLNIGTNFNGPVQNGYIPYGAAIAVGPNHVIVLSNAQFAVYTRAGALISLKQNSQIFPTDAGVNSSPKCYYDAAGGRFVILAAQAQYPSAYMNVAVSQTSDPTGNWWMYHLDWTVDGSTPTGNWGDWPNLGYDDNAIYITANQFSFSNIYQYSKVRVLSKSQLFIGETAAWTDFANLRNADGTSAFCLSPGQMLSSSASEYLLNNIPSGGKSVTLWRIDNAPSTPTLTRVATVSISAYTMPPDGRQPGRKSPYVATGDCRLQDVVMQGGNLHTAFTYNAGSKAGAGIRYLKISTSGVVSKDISYFTSGTDYYYPAVTVDASDNMIMVVSRSSTSEYPSMYRTGMKTTETAIEAATLVKGGQGLVINGRWGDYNGIHNDPSNSGTVWMYCGWEQSNSTWGSYVAATSFGLPPSTQAMQNSQEGNVRSFTLNANYPNPFNPSTKISYALPEEIYTKLVVYDALGRQVATLVDGVQTAGEHQATFNAAGLSSGVYFYRIEAGRNISFNKMLLTK